MQFGLYSASEWVFPDSELSGAKTLTLNAARGGYVGFQLKLTGLEPDAALSLSGVSGSPLTMEIYRLVDVNVTKNTGRIGNTWEESDGEPEYVTRRAPFRVYDALRPYHPGQEISKGIDAFYICFFVPATAFTGDYHEPITVSVGGETVSFTIDVTVWPAVIPEKETLNVTNWFSAATMAAYHHVEPWSEEHWELIRRYGALMRRARQNVFWVKAEMIRPYKENGVYRFDFSRAERLIRMYLDMGFSVIEGAPIAHRHRWRDADFFVGGGEHEIAADSAEGYAFMAALLKAWRAFLEENGWYSLLIQHAADEPHAGCRDGYYRVASVVRQFLPGVRIVEAVEIPELQGAVDIWVPKDHYYIDHQAEFEAVREAGNELWFYTCCYPGGHFLNRLLDKPLIEVRYLHWGSFKYNLTGFLHWGFNHYRFDMNPFEETTPPNGDNTFLPPGDTHIVYPGEDGPWSSMRLENHRFGTQDYELFKLLAEKDAPRAHAIMDSVFRAFDDVELNPASLENARLALLTALKG